MTLQALLVSGHDQTAETLIQALAQFGIGAARSSAGDVATARLAEERFDLVIVDFDEPELASQLLESCRHLAGPERNPPVTVAVLPDSRQIRTILGSGTHFVLTKPVSPEQAQTTFRAASAILKRERRQSFRVAVQAAVSIQHDDSTVEGILLDLSAGGVDVLAAKPLPNSALVHLSFELPDGGVHVEAEGEVAWTIANGQTGFRFLGMGAEIRQQLAEWLAARSHEALPDETDAPSPCKLTDLSLGGCYVQTESPFPQSSAIDLCLRVAGIEIHAEGLVRVMHPGHGMGIEFPARTDEQRKSVEEFIKCLSSQPGTEPHLEISPRSLLASAVDLSQNPGAQTDAEDSLLELLRSGGAMDEEAFLAELVRQRAPDAVSQ